MHTVETIHVVSISIKRVLLKSLNGKSNANGTHLLVNIDNYKRSLVWFGLGRYDLFFTTRGLIRPGPTA